MSNFNKDIYLPPLYCFKRRSAHWVWHRWYGMSGCIAALIDMSWRGLDLKHTDGRTHIHVIQTYRGADKSLAWPGRKQATSMSKSSLMMDPTRSCEMRSCSSIDLAEIRRSSKISSWIRSIISGVVGLRTYQHPSTSTSRLWGDHFQSHSNSIRLWYTIQTSCWHIQTLRPIVGTARPSDQLLAQPGPQTSYWHSQTLGPASGTARP